MAEATDPKKHTVKNSGVDEQQLSKVLELVAELKKLGVKPAQYDLANPYERTIYEQRSEK